VNSSERVTAAFGGHAVDRVPFAVWRHFYPDENEGPAKLAETTIAFTKRHQLDLIKYNPRAHYHAEPWGTRYRYGKDGRPVLERYAVRKPEDWARIGRKSIREPAFQELLVAPLGARNVREAIELNFKVHYGVGKKLSKTLNYPVGKGDEGGWSPGLTDIEALGVVSEVVGEVQDETGSRIRIGVDVAADSLHDPKKGGYYYRTTKKTLTREEQIAFISELCDKYDLLYVEDPLYEDDFDGYAELHSALKKTLITGDDLYTTDVDRLKTGVSKNSTNGVIMKVNQIGTLWEAQQFSNLAKKTGHVVVASHRSGDNEGGHLAHFAVGFRCGLMKSGVVGGERTAKLNELMRIGEELGTGAKMASVRP